jgi:hypothetical protein
MPMVSSCKSTHKSQFRYMLWQTEPYGVETHVVLAPQTIATYQMAPHNVHNQSMSSDYLKGRWSTNPQWICCLPCIIHNSAMYTAICMSSLVVWAHGAPSLPIHRHKTITWTAPDCCFVQYPLLWRWHICMQRVGRVEGDKNRSVGRNSGVWGHVRWTDWCWEL